VLLTIKGFLPLNTCGNVWIPRVTLRLDPKLFFPFQRTMLKEMFLTMVIDCLDLYLQPQLDATPTTMVTFDL
jgi:hypothetical protein